MKKGISGVSSKPLKVSLFQLSTPLNKNSSLRFFRVTGEALENYRDNRENGTEKNDPKGEDFPGDGTYSWETPGNDWSKVIYHEGEKDREWMKKKDFNYQNGIENSEDEDSEDSKGSENSTSYSP